MLASFGIHTAGDVDLYKIDGIQGFGPALVSELMSWKQGVEIRFVFNPAEPINPADILRVRTANSHSEGGIREKGA